MVYPFRRLRFWGLKLDGDVYINSNHQVGQQIYYNPLLSSV